MWARDQRYEVGFPLVEVLVQGGDELIQHRRSPPVTRGLSPGLQQGPHGSRRVDQFGNPRGTTTGSWVGNHGFLGGTVATTNTTGLVHLGAREYNPATGTFLSVDPVMDLTDPTQWNAYSYAQNSPITLSDADGNRPLGAGDNGCECHRLRA